MKDVWNIESGRMGQTLVLKADYLEWVKYEIPSTSYSGGGSQNFYYSDIFEGSPIANAIENEFGKQVLFEVLEEIDKRKFKA